ncbi:MAG: CoA pyrophosphatase [Burkholderiales bacterium]
MANDASHANVDTAWLRSRFAGRVANSMMKEIPAEIKTLRAASVLIPIIERDAGLTVLFTRRTEHLQAHAGQISFPGGGAEESDESPIATALRETEEEIGLHRRHVEVLGSLDLHPTVTGYRVTPVVGLVRPPFDLRLDAFEVAEIFEVPLTFLLDPANRRRDSMVREGRVREFDAVPYGPHYIWGATAAMLVQFHRFLLGEAQS